MSRGIKRAVDSGKERGMFEYNRHSRGLLLFYEHVLGFSGANGGRFGAVRARFLWISPGGDGAGGFVPGGRAAWGVGARSGGGEFWGLSGDRSGKIKPSGSHQGSKSSKQQHPSPKEIPRT